MPKCIFLVFGFNEFVFLSQQEKFSVKERHGQIENFSHFVLTFKSPATKHGETHLSAVVDELFECV